MKQQLYACALLTIMSTAHAAEISVESQTRAKVPLAVITLGAKKNIKACGEQLAKDLSFTSQFAVETRMQEGIPSKKEMRAMAQEGYPLALFVSESAEGIDWRLYDTMLAKMVIGKRCKKNSEKMHEWAHAVADAVWPVLTNEPGFFSTKIAYCKNAKRRGCRAAKYICVADYDGSHEYTVVAKPTVTIAPRWHGDPRQPMLFYSEYTKKNTALMSTDLQGHHQVACNYDGINMQPTFSKSGTYAVFSSSRGDAACQLYYYDAQGIKRLSHNDGNNVSPTMDVDANMIYYCSDAQLNTPHIYAHDLKTGESKRITQQGYCASPSFNRAKKTLAYSRMVNGNMQVFVYNPARDTHEQITFDESSKEECCWSPCGNFLLFSVEKAGDGSRIAMQSMHTGERHYLTAHGSECSYPAWSPVYCTFPATIKS